MDALGGTPSQRSSAKRDLFALGSQVVHPLIREVRTGVGHRSWAAAELLGELADPLGLPALVDALLSPNPILGSAAARALVNFPEWRAADHLAQALPQVHVVTQQNIVLSLLELGEPGTTGALMKLLNDASSPALQCVVVQALGELGDQAAAPAIEALLDDEDHHVRQWAETALAQIGAGDAGHSVE